MSSKEDKGNAIVRQENALTVHNPRVVATASSLGWRPQTLVRRIEGALESPGEQMLYLTVIEGFDVTLTPETFNTLMRVFHGRGVFNNNNVIFTGVGKNLQVNTISEMEEYIHVALQLVDRFREGTKLHLGYKLASRLALVYGEHALVLMEEVQENLGRCQEVLGFATSDHYRILHGVAYKVLKYAERGGPTPQSIMDIFPELAHR